MTTTFEARDGAIVSDGAALSLTLRHGEYDEEHERRGVGKAGDPVEVAVRGVVRRFEQVERVYDEEGIAVGKRVEVHWEVVTGDPRCPAVGFLPENVLTASET